MHNQQILHDAMALRGADFNRLQHELDVTFKQGVQEATQDFRKRVLTAVEQQGKLRQLEMLLTS